MDVPSVVSLLSVTALTAHLVLCALSLALPILTLAAEWRWVRTERVQYRTLARRWARATGLTFSVTAASGALLLLQLAVFWPGGVQLTGGVLAPALLLAFFTGTMAAIALERHNHGWDRVKPREHLPGGVPVVLWAVATGGLLLVAHAWLQKPVGFTAADGVLLDALPLAVARSPLTAAHVIHVVLACCTAVGFLVASIYAAGALRGRRDAYHHAGMAVALAVGMVAALLQPLAGLPALRNMAAYQPMKFAATQAHFETSASAPLLLGGVPDLAERRLRGGVPVPGVLSLVVAGDRSAVVMGLNETATSAWPNVPAIRTAFQLLLLCGTLLLLIGLAYWLRQWRGRDPGPVLLAAITAGGVVALGDFLAGAAVSLLGQHPWFVRHVLRLADAATQDPAAPALLAVLAAVHVALLGCLLPLLTRSAAGAPEVAATSVVFR
jgi:cytochrome bd ubiquinol oxidase subunit I